jgi:cyanophycinase
VNVVDAHPNLLGLGLDDDAALIVQGDRFQVIGTGRVAVYDDARHPEGWYDRLRPRDEFDLRARKEDLIRATATPEAAVRDHRGPAP